ncbi:MAG: pilus assembly protein TadG-related protein, partial [Bacillota bacterium]|nr:pilus assembly protein TadG-related protein [Bacillota bacterium]
KYIRKIFISLKSFHLIKNERGSIVIIVAAALVVLLGLTALVTDAGILYLNRSRLQTAVDAAALAGAQELPASSIGARNDATQYANNNGINAGELLPINISSNDREITVSARRDVDMFFAKVLNFNSVEVPVVAKARIEAGSGVMPIGIPEEAWVGNFGTDELHEVGSAYILKGKSHTDATYPQISGWYGGLKAEGYQGANDFKDNIVWGMDLRLNVEDELVEVDFDIGAELEEEKGVMSGPTAEGVKIRIDQCSNDDISWKDFVIDGTFIGFDDLKAKECSRIIIVPRVKETDENKIMEITGFEVFFLEGVNGLNNAGNGNASSEVIGIYLGPLEGNSTKSHYYARLVQ